MKIAIVVSYTFPYIGSGIGNVALKQAEELAKRGHKVTLISSNIPKTKKEFRRKNVKHFKLKSTNFLERFKIPVPIFLPTNKLISKIKEAEIIHIHDVLYPSSIFAAFFAKIFKKPIILTQHIGFVYYKNKVARLIERLMYLTFGRILFKLSKKIIVLNSSVRDYIIKLGADENKISYIPNGVETLLFSPASAERKKTIRRRYSFPLNKPIILFVGRLVEKKGFDKLFDARDKDYLIVFVGEGEVPKYMREDKNVIFFGKVPPNKLSEIYKASDVFCLPSNGEGFPLSIQEAMATGLPIITTNHPGYNRYLDKKHVKLINPTAEHIKKVINEIISNSSLIKKMSKYSKKAATKEFNWDRNINNLIKIYEKVNGK